ncbi:cytochrome c family protein [Acetobacter estunensis NRIC 0472]|uniref:Cytochrome c n=1 Tax=Acetobacter estunensis TaxID=104097 RepID=A0A967BAV5_9PROT|nr:MULTISPECIES: cytochrome c [Acetobacter]NHN93484.1 cytochrome c [Acetobacter sicerae]NHO55331.1 cytochrome c [Acetobacter estunensis]GBQ24030.1 cytochrome c family protein [Acetobacter estunensis NRIC 0472]
MTRLIWGFAGILLFGIGAGATVVFGGLYDVSATSPHWRLTYRVLETARLHSIRHHAEGITAPVDLETQARLVGGASHFSTHCASCHSAPGVEAEDMAVGMYPKPPVLKDVAQRYTPGELFWILKHGIKMSGMPSWADHGDDDLWNIVAFLGSLPGMNSSDYQALVAQAGAAGGHHTHHDMDMPMPRP